MDATITEELIEENKQEAPLSPELSEEYKFNEKGEIVPKTSSGREDPRQQICWNLYLETIADGKPNVCASAVAAGYTDAFSKVVYRTKWFKEKKKKLKRTGMLSLAEKNLENVLKMPYKKTRIKDGEEYLEVDTDVLKIIVDVSKAVVKSLGKDEGYSERSEVTGKGGDPIVFMPAELLNKHGLNEDNK